MCGIVGSWSLQGDRLVATITKMTDRLQHRGPDDQGVWVDERSELALGHRRLSIVDLTTAGHQPMVSSCGRYVLVFNGEIYNHEAIRLELASTECDIAWKGHSDTETLLFALATWGLEQTLSRLNGMFAFALWDKQQRQLSLARDRMGEKPLYYGLNGGALLFGSELKALTAHPCWQGEINRNALALYMRHGYVPTPWSIYQGIYKLPPAHFVVLNTSVEPLSEPVCYWDIAEIAEAGAGQKGDDPAAMVQQLDTLLRDSIALRMDADVPLGAFLSGGYDSTTVVALMQAQAKAPVKTFSIGFHEAGYNEAEHAKVVAKHLGTEHTELYVTPEEAMDVIPELPIYWDEPFADSSQIPTYLVSKLARKQVTVSLSGDGGDELFCGYGRYAFGQKVWSRLDRVPRPVRQAVASGVKTVPVSVWDTLMKPVPSKYKIDAFGDRIHKFSDVLNLASENAFYHRLVSLWHKPEAIVLGSCEPDTLLSSAGIQPCFTDMRERMMYLDSLSYLPDDILTKVDRASMAVGLEARVPLLDHRLVEFAWRVPMSMKVRGDESKWLLRQVLYRYVPPELMDRPKMGFGVPIEHWLCGPLREWGESLLNEQRLKEEGFFDHQTVRMMWRAHISGERRWHYHLWCVLMFQAWLDEQRE